jgi:hypothetical protein
VSDDYADNDGANHVTQHFGVLWVDNFPFFMPLWVIQIVKS